MASGKGDWVRIHSVMMRSGDRPPGIPVDTADVPYELWAKGFLISEKAEIGEKVEIETITGRIIKGNLVESNPSYNHNFGKFIPEILAVDRHLKELMKGISQ